MTFADDVRRGLTAARKAIPPQYFYDDVGSALFSAICELPEYYLTRAEAEILRTHGREIAAALGSPARLIELGSGSARKTRLLLETMRDVEFVPVDIDSSLLQKTAESLRVEYPSIRVTPVAADFRTPAGWLGPAPGGTATLLLGSTIGNLTRDEAVERLLTTRSFMQRGDFILVGADLRKTSAVLEAAYNDALGVTAAFNMNLLQRINRELGGRFDLRRFAHRAFYNDSECRIEMHLVSLREQTVWIEAIGLEVAFDAGETIHTENSHKYDDASIESIATAAGFSLVRRWTDVRGWFADYLLVLE